MNKQDYNKVMADIEAGKKITQEVFDETTAFAKKAKVKRPSEDAIKKARAKKVAEPKAPKEPKVKAKCSVDDCDIESRAGGMCATHYSRLLYRAKPENALKAREASNRYAARKRAEKAEAKAAAELEAVPAETAA